MFYSASFITANTVETFSNSDVFVVLVNSHIPELLLCCIWILTHDLFSSVDGVNTPTTSTQVFYISVSVCCIVIFLVAIILAILHLHSMKRVEMEDRFVMLSLVSSCDSDKTLATAYIPAKHIYVATEIIQVHNTVDLQSLPVRVRLVFMQYPIRR